MGTALQGISASPMTEDNIFQWNASIVGPDESPWEGGLRLEQTVQVCSFRSAVASITAPIRVSMPAHAIIGFRLVTAGGIFGLRLQFPDQYPDKPPKIRFICDIFHPNVYPDGSLCLDIIQDLWKPIYTVDMLLTSIQSLLTDPNVDSPANVEAARLFRTDMKMYKRRVRRMAAKTIE